MMDLELPGSTTKALTSYLRDLLGRDVALEPRPRVIARGLRTDVYEFGLAAEGLDGAWAGPLVLRLSSKEQPRAVLDHEVEAQRVLRSRGFPVPEILAAEASGEVIGQAFCVMERALGKPMRSTAFGDPLAARRMATTFARTQAALHRLSIEGFPRQDRVPSVERQLEFYRSWLGKDENSVSDFAWLESRKDAVLPEEPSICHNNYVPSNLVVDERGGVQVIDWSESRVGDRHGDVADALVFMRTEPVRESTLARRAVSRLSRAVFLRQYIGRYQQELPLDRRRLCYWEALRAFAWKSTISALMDAAVTRSGLTRSTYERQRRDLDQYFRARQREFESSA